LMGRNIRVWWSLTWLWGWKGTAVEIASALRRAYSGEEDDGMWGVARRGGRLLPVTISTTRLQGCGASWWCGFLGASFYRAS
jgi:hypothetical protein